MLIEEKIFNIFIDSNVTVKSKKKLWDYIQFCLINKLEKKDQSSLHHILPQGIFKQFSNLSINKWNGAHLLYRDHYYAHWLLTEAILDISSLYAFCAMHNKDPKIGRIQEEELINANIVQLKMQEKNKQHSNWHHTIRSSGLTNTEEIMIKVNKTLSKVCNVTGLTGFESRVNKSVITRKKVNSYTGLTGYQESAKKLSNTVSKLDPKTGMSINDKRSIYFTKVLCKINSSGLTEAQERADKATKTRTRINLETGLSNAQEAGIKSSITKKSKNKKI